MNEPMLGLLIEGEAQRDAIHVALSPVTSDEQLNPGQRVALVEGDPTKVKASNSSTVGIVDPFLRNPVKPGQRFWLCLYCRTVTSLRHQWTHPQFPEEGMSTMVDKQKSRDWIENYANSLDLTYDEIMGGANQALIDDTHSISTDRDEDTAPEFWDHFQIVTGRKLELTRNINFFHCSC